MFKRLNLSHHKHSGRLRPHEYTSYFPLALLLIFVGFTLMICTASAASPPPQAGSVAVKGTMPGPPPAVGATITSPANGTRFTSTPVTISGTCAAGNLIEVFKNDIFAGSSPCKDGGTFSLDIDLMIGQNILIARTYDALNQTGPDSKPITVFYDALPTQAGALTPLDFGTRQLILITDAVYRGMFPKQEFNVPITVLGGRPPYAINVEWGDGKNKVTPRGDNQTFNVAHTYQKPGTFQISMQATDADGRVAFITVAAIVNGQPEAAGASFTDKGTTNKLLVLWPLFLCIVVMVISFWLGERREKKLLLRHGLYSDPLRQHPAV